MNLATSCSLVHVLTSYNLSFPFWNLCKSSSRPCRPVPYGPICSASAIQPISFLLVVSQNSFNSVKLQISNPKFPLLLFTLSNTLKQSYTTVLLISQDTLQSSAADLVELHASLLVEQDGNQRGPRFTKEPSRVKQHHNSPCSQNSSLPEKMPRPT